jgi:putative transposase
VSTDDARDDRAAYRRGMPRPQRFFVANGTYHVFSRGSNRQAIFAFDGDRVDFLECLRRAVERHSVRCLAYCLMPNHYHLIVRTPGAALSNAMKEVNGRYAQRFNRRYRRDAHLFKNRFRAVHLVGESHLLWASAYVAANPVRAGLCAEAGEWPWSSYRATSGLEKTPSFLQRAQLLSYFGATPEQAVNSYNALVAACR